MGLLTLPPQDTTTVDVAGLEPRRIPGWRRHSAERLGGRFDAGAGAVAGTSGYVPNQMRPESLQWNIGIQHVFHDELHL